MSFAPRPLLLLCLLPCIHGCDAGAPPAPERRAAPALSGEVQLASAGEANGVLALLVRSADGRELLHVVARDLADPAVGEADGVRTLRFHLEAADLAGAGEQVLLEARYDPDGVVATDEPGSLRQRRVTAFGGGAQRFLLEAPPVTAESAAPPRAAR